MPSVSIVSLPCGVTAARISEPVLVLAVLVLAAGVSEPVLVEGVLALAAGVSEPVLVLDVLLLDLLYLTPKNRNLLDNRNPTEDHKPTQFPAHKPEDHKATQTPSDVPMEAFRNTPGPYRSMMDLYYTAASYSAKRLEHQVHIYCKAKYPGEIAIPLDHRDLSVH